MVHLVVVFGYLFFYLYLKHEEKHLNVYKFLLLKERFIKRNINNNYQKLFDMPSQQCLLFYLMLNLRSDHERFLASFLYIEFSISILARYYSSIAFFVMNVFFCVCCIYVLIMLWFFFVKIFNEYFEISLIVEETFICTVYLVFNKIERQSLFCLILKFCWGKNCAQMLGLI